MRPVRLTMTAFGPFAGTEVVDFRAALDAGLFGIYGPTGAGKSSIFNAMTFALFGESAKSGQDRSALRSDHADRATMTRVSFVFELGAKRYVLHRIPDQSRPKVHGEGETKQTHEAYLFDATAIAVDDITDDNCGKIIAEKKVSVVNAALQELLGYGATQFRQIVLLPQGEFERFLTSGTTERIGILRQLFDVSQYRRLEDWFKEEAAKADKAIREASTKYVGRLEGEGFESVAALTLGIASAQEALDTATASEDAAQKVQNGTAATLQAAETLAGAFDAQVSAQAKLAALADRKPQMGALEQALIAAKTAQGLLDLADTVTRAEAQEREAARDVQHKEQAAVMSEADAAKAAAVLTDLQQSEGEIDILKQRRADLERLRATLAKVATQAATVEQTQAALANAVAEATRSEAELQHLQHQRASAVHQRESGRDAAQRRAELAVSKAEAEAVLAVANTFAAATESTAQAARALEDIRRAERRTREHKEAANAALATAERQLAHVQALHLAEALKDGTPCPVCGSSDHPNRAQGDAAGRGLTEAFRTAQTQAREAEEMWHRDAQKLEGAKVLHTDRVAQLGKLAAPEITLEAAKASVVKIREELAALPASAAGADIEARITALDSRLIKAEAAEKLADAIRQTADTAHALARQAHQDALALVPEDLRANGALSAALGRVSGEIADRQTALTTAFDAEKRTGKAALTALKEAEAAQAAHAKCKQAREDALARFAARLTIAGMSPEDFDRHRLRIPQIAHDETALAEFRTDLAVAESDLRDADAKVAGKIRPELIPMRAADQQARDAVQRAAEHKGEARQRHSHLVGLSRSIADEIDRIAMLEAESAPLRELARQFNGQTDARLTLETYAIQAMFEQVLTAANLRLEPMSAGRYRLEIQNENMKGAAKRGLGIQVFDNWTGKPRSTADISGGETFIAALSLALGLSDVVESNAGSIRLDTIFIDEGFGSLDGEDGSGTLDQVLATLTQTAGETRAVGLISHVGLVKEAIPNGFQIDKTPRGSHIRERDVG